MRHQQLPHFIFKRHAAHCGGNIIEATPDGVLYDEYEWKHYASLSVAIQTISHRTARREMHEIRDFFLQIARYGLLCSDLVEYGFDDFLNDAITFSPGELKSHNTGPGWIQNSRNRTPSQNVNGFL